MFAEENRKLVQSSIEFPWDDSQVSTVEDSALGAMGKWALGMSFLWIELPNPGPEVRGQLGLFIEKAIEEALERRGAVSAGISATTGLDVSLSDQLYRARLIELRGLALGIPSLEGISNRGRTLDAEDSAVLRWWMAASTDRPVRLVVADSNKSLRVYPSPILFESLYQVAPQPVTPRPPSTVMAESAESMELSDLPPAVALQSLEANAEEEVREAETKSGVSCEYDADLPDLDRALGFHDDLVSEPGDQSTTGESTDALKSSASESSPSSGSPAFVAEKSPLLTAREQLALSYPPPETSAISESVGSTDEMSEIVEQGVSNIKDAKPERPAIISALTQSESQPLSLPTKAMSQSALERLASLKPAARERTNSQSIVENLAIKQAAKDAASEVDEFGRRPIVSSPVIQAELPVSENASNAVEEGAEAPQLHQEADGEHDVELPAESTASLTSEVEAAIPEVRAAAKTEAATDLVESENEDAFDRLAKAEWRLWARQLEASRGPRPLSVVERHFVTEYTRLREAARRGIADPSVEELLDAWGTDFSKSYTDAFDALRVRGKRPTMVLDIPEAAARLGRLQGARRVQLVMVDSLRFDLGLMLQDRLRSQVDAALTERLLLWSALPTTTTYQLQLLAKGVDGLKEPGSVDEAPALVARGRAALSPRRIRAGRLELFKVDTVADALAQPGAPIKDRLPEIASSAADVLAEHFKKQPARTLVVVFGDHGFRLNNNAIGTAEEVETGGSSPEEVLVPAFAWLTGAVH